MEDEQVKAARHLQPTPAADCSITVYGDELHAIAARLRDLTEWLVSHPVEQAPLRAQLRIAHIRTSAALQSIQDAERSLGLAGIWRM